MARNPDRNYAIHWLDQGAREAAVAALSGATGTGTGTGGTGGTTDPVVEFAGDVRGALLGAKFVVGIHGDEITPAALAADADDYAPAGSDALIWRLDLAGFTVTGFAAPAQPGEVHVIVALSAGTLAHEDAGSAAANRILVGGDADLALDVDDVALLVYDGTSQRWRVAGKPATPVVTTFVFGETPAGTVDASNVTFTLANAPIGLLLSKNGLVQRAGSGNDYTLSGSTITFEAGNVPATGDILQATYSY